MPNDLLTVAQAAELIGIHEGTVRKAIQQGRLDAIKMSARVVLIRRREAEHYRDTPRQPGGRRKPPATDAAGGRG